MRSTLTERIAAGVLAVAAAIAVGNGDVQTMVPSFSQAALAAPTFCDGTTSPPFPATGQSTSRGPKTPIHGLLDLGQTSENDLRNPPPNPLYYLCQVYPAISGLVVNDAWASLQPNGPNTPIDTRNIDAQLAAVGAYNKAAPRPIGVRLRIWAGMSAPEWAKNIGGPPIHICDPSGGVVASPMTSPVRAPTPCPSSGAQSDVKTTGRFWTAEYQQAWANAQKQLAAKYDTNPLVQEVSVMSCASGGDEEFIHPTDGWSLRNLVAAGYTTQAYKSCLEHALAAYSGWHMTIVDYIVNPFYYNVTGKPLQWQVGVTEAMMRRCVALLRSRCLLDNQEMGKYGASPGGNTAPNVTALFEMWHFIGTLRAQGALVTFQPAGPPSLYKAAGSNFTGWNGAVQLAKQSGADSLELWPSTGPRRVCPPNNWFHGYWCFSVATLQRWSTILTR